MSRANSSARTVSAMDTRATFEKMKRFNRLEYWDMARAVNPEITEAEFEVLWRAFCEQKRWKRLH